MALTDADKLTRIRRFYKEAVVGTGEHGFTVLLDGRTAKTSGGAVLAAPTRALAELLAAEWGAQGEHIDFASMPATRLAFTAIDRGGQARDGLAKEVARYAGSDTLCYLAEGPRALVERQRAQWAPWRDWAARDLGLRFEATDGLMHTPQPRETLTAVEAMAEALPDLALTGLVFAAGLYGSAILALAVQRGALDAVEAFELSRLEEVVQAEQWGQDAEAQARTEALREEAAIIGRWFVALR
jgi:chaperone required for assembly of F1-ATPase